MFWHFQLKMAENGTGKIEQATLERCIEEDHAIHKALAITTDLEAAQTAHENVEECLWQHFASIEQNWKRRRRIAWEDKTRTARRG